ncbi:MAG: SDR family NAD(P)-dependent oxidoreductase [Acidimicrobiales bacterium]
MRGLEGKVAIVTGGGAGIGRATALRLAEEGVSVTIGDLDGDRAQVVADEIPELGRHALALQADVSDDEASGQLVAAAVDHFGRLDILINNAGMPARNQTGHPFEIWDRGVHQSLSSAYRMSETCLPHLLANETSAIVSLSSTIGTQTHGLADWYAAAKAGVAGLTIALAGRHGRQGLRANAVAPGLIRTQRTEGIWISEQKLDRAVSRIPLQRGAAPEEVASAIAFLASDDASYISGQVLTIDGGFAIG